MIAIRSLASKYGSAAYCPAHDEVPAAVEDTILRALSAEDSGAALRIDEPGGRRYRTVCHAIDEWRRPRTNQSAGANQRRRHFGLRRDGARAHERFVVGHASGAKKDRDVGETTKPNVIQLALPLALIAALAAAVVGVKRRAAPPSVPVTAPRPTSTVPEAETAYKDAMRLWHDGATVKARTAFAKAVELDLRLWGRISAIAIHTQQEDPAAAQAAFQSAFEHREMLLGARQTPPCSRPANPTFVKSPISMNGRPA